MHVVTCLWSMNYCMLVSLLDVCHVKLIYAASVSIFCEFPSVLVKVQAFLFLLNIC